MGLAVRRLTASVILGMVLGATGFAVSAAPRVVATTGMVGDTVGVIGGECIETTTLMGPGVDPHLYQASASDVRAFQQAALIAYNGFGLEGQLDTVLERLGERRPTLAVAEAAAAAAGDEALLAGAQGYAIDPHLWMDTALWAQAITPVADALVDVAPECANAIRTRAERLAGELVALDGWIRASLASIPARQRVLLTAHDAFRYFGRAYAIEVRGIQGISTSAEASVADIRNTAELIVERGIPAIFVETTISPRTVEAVLQAARQRSADVVLGGALYGDALGERGTLADSLIGMHVHNTAAIAAGLGGNTAPLPAALERWRAALEAEGAAGIE